MLLQRYLIPLLFAAATQADVSIIRFNDRNITVVPGDNPGLPSYKMRFGTFAAGFTPTLANFSQWDANFNGSTGSHTPGVTTTIDFTASDNSVHAVGSMMYMLVYNIAPNAPTSTATSAALLTRVDWLTQTYGWHDTQGFDERGRPITGEVLYNYQFGFGGWEIGLRNWDEDNYLPLTDLSPYSSLVNDLVLVNGGIGVTSSFSAVPESSSLGWVGLALAAAAVARRRRAAKAA